MTSATSSSRLGPGAQDIFAGAQRSAVRKERTRHPYVLSGLVCCALCGRTMQGSWNHGNAYYRCKFPAEYAITEDQHAKTVYVREQAIVPSLDTWIGSLFAEEHLDATCDALAAVSDLDPQDDEGRQLDLRRQLRECDAKLARYRALLEHDDQITLVANWIAEVERERKHLERELGRKPTGRKLTKTEIKVLVRQLKDIVAVLADADPKGCVTVSPAVHSEPRCATLPNLMDAGRSRPLAGSTEPTDP